MNYLINRIGSIECSFHPDPFEFLIDEIIAQMLSIKVANIIRQRFLNVCDNEITPSIISQLDIEKYNLQGFQNAKHHT